MKKRFVNRAKSGASVLHGPAPRPGAPRRQPAGVKAAAGRGESRDADRPGGRPRRHR